MHVLVVVVMSNNNSELRPVGTEYTEDYLPSPGSTDQRIRRMTWRVVSHEPCLENGKLVVLETIQATKCEYLEDQCQ